jgi:hypothetical protein
LVLTKIITFWCSANTVGAFATQTITVTHAPIPMGTTLGVGTGLLAAIKARFQWIFHFVVTIGRFTNAIVAAGQRHAIGSCSA